MDTLPLPPRPDLAQYRKRAKALVAAAQSTDPDAVLAGDLATLNALLREHPDLIRAHSKRVHHATLLHYVAANGVEDFRQKTPPNAVAVARFLLDAGAKVDALADTYGSDWYQTTM